MLPNMTKTYRGALVQTSQQLGLPPPHFLDIPYHIEDALLPPQPPARPGTVVKS